MSKKITLLILLTLLFTAFSIVKAEESLPNLTPTALKARIGLNGTDYNLNDTSKSFDVGDSLNITGNYENSGGSYTVADPANPFLSNLKITKNGKTFLDSTQTSNSGAIAGFWVWTPTEAGTYTVVLTLDKNNAISESNENNNTFEKTITIAGLPNLTPTALKARIGLNGTDYNLNDTSKSFDVGDSLNITGNYQNLGGLYTVADPANPFLSNLKITKNGKTFLDSNDNANSGAIAGLWDWTPTEAGTYTVVLTLDKNNAISESSETNNTLEKTITVNTTAATYSIGLNPSGMNGTIVSSPAGINCSVVIGTTGYVSGTCVANFPAGTTVTLTASPASGNIFSNWSTWYNSNNGGCTGSSSTCTLTMNKDYVLGALFDSAQPPITNYSLGLMPSGTNGTIVSSPAGINCSVIDGQPSGSCGVNFPAGTTVTLTATPASGGVFTSWSTSTGDSGGCTGSSPVCTLTMNRNHQLGAVFSAQTSTISNVRVTNITSNSAVVNWSTAEPDISYLQYGLVNSDDGINTEARNNNIVTVHVVLLNNLQSEKTYYFRISANSQSDSAQNATIFNYRSGIYNFTTAVSSDNQISQININANLLINDKMSQILAELDQLRSIIKEQQTQIIYLSSLLKDVQGISAASQAVLNNFITYGVDANTVKLGAGERAAVINSYKAAFDKLPTTEAELADVIKIANGRWPSITNKDAENQAKAQFLKIYKRVADMNGANDNAAVTIMAYGLRQKAENRNLNSEVNGIKIFKAIYGHTPRTTEEWNAMQAITYSGATQKTWSGYNPNGN